MNSSSVLVVVLSLFAFASLALIILPMADGWLDRRGSRGLGELLAQLETQVDQGRTLSESDLERLAAHLSLRMSEDRKSRVYRLLGYRATGLGSDGRGVKL